MGNPKKVAAAGPAVRIFTKKSLGNTAGVGYIIFLKRQGAVRTWRVEVHKPGPLPVPVRSLPFRAFFGPGVRSAVRRYAALHPFRGAILRKIPRRWVEPALCSGRATAAVHFPRVGGRACGLATGPGKDGWLDRQLRGMSPRSAVPRAAARRSGAGPAAEPADIAPQSRPRARGLSGTFGLCRRLRGGGLTW